MKELTSPGPVCADGVLPAAVRSQAVASRTQCASRGLLLVCVLSMKAD